VIPIKQEKKGTDIRNGKCSWLTIVALQRASPDQRQVLEDHYGKPFPQSEEAVLNLYKKLGLPNTYSIYAQESHNIIRTHVQQTSQGLLPHDFFFNLWKIHTYKSE